jgi:chromosome segregation ATPase
MAACNFFFHAFFFLAALLPGCLGRLAKPSDDAAHGLLASGAEASSGAGALANPEVDAWHEKEKARIEMECNEMLRKLDAEKRRRLQDIVNQREKELEEELRKLAAAKAKAQAEATELKTEEDEAAHELAKVSPKKEAIDRADQIRAKWQREVDRLRRLIAQKEACIEQLREAERKLLAAREELEAARKRLAEAEAAAAAQKDSLQTEQSHLKKEQDNVTGAEEDFEAAKARLRAALEELAKAEQDLKEHDEATPDSYPGGQSALADGAKDVTTAAPKPAKSGTQASAGATAALLVLTFSLL